MIFPLCFLPADAAAVGCCQFLISDVVSIGGKAASGIISTLP